MANTKISALTSATTPLAGTEVLPIVQSGATVQVSVANLTSGRAISATAVIASTGNFVVGTSGQGVDFSATPGTGTSELLADYEEGTWTPTVTPQTGSFTTVTAGTSTYTKIGRIVTVNARFTLTNSGTGAGVMTIAGLPYTIVSAYDQNTFTGRVVNTGTPIFGQLVGGATSLENFATIAGTTAITNGNIYTLTATYAV
jgi:hypothetical protein